METLEIHSKDFLVKWVHAPDNSVVDWQVKPLKKSINFAIYRKNDLVDQDENDNDAVTVTGSTNNSPASGGHGNARSINNDSIRSSPNASTLLNEDTRSNHHDPSRHAQNTSPAPNGASKAGNVSAQSKTGNVSAAAGAAAALNHASGTTNNTAAPQGSPAAAAAAAALQPPTLTRNRLRSNSRASVNQFTESNAYKSKSRSSTFSSNLNSSDLALIKDYNKLIAEELVHGIFEVKEGGVYAFIFDNSFSKTIGKKVLFSSKIVLKSPAANSPSNLASGSNPYRRPVGRQGSGSFNLGGGSNVSFQNAQAVSAQPQGPDQVRPLPSMTPKQLNRSNTSNDFLKGGASDAATTTAASIVPSTLSDPGASSVSFPDDVNEPENQNNTTNSNSALSQGPNILRPKNGELLQSVLLKKRRKKLQGFTKRYFVLNFKYGTLSYFRVDDNKLRGQMPIKHSIVSANAQNREIIIDSGMEVWDLKAISESDFKAWVEAFNQVKQSHYSNNGTNKVAGASPGGSNGNYNENYDEYDDFYDNNDDEIDGNKNVDQNFIVEKLGEISHDLDRLKLSTANTTPNQLASDINDISYQVNKLAAHLKSSPSISTGAANRASVIASKNDAVSTYSSNDFYDANEYIDAMNKGVVLIGGEKGTEAANSKGAVPDDDDEDDVDEDDADQLNDEDDEASSSGSEDEDEDSPSVITETPSKQNPSLKDSEVGGQSGDSDHTLYPLPHDPVQRDCDIPIALHEPLSILGFVRKNVGKDLTSIPMPVEMNEPLSILQKFAEVVEYCDLINNAITGDFDDSTGERILRIATFAVSYLSSMRMKERNARKPFNPLLGETFELVREDFGIRLVCEKVSHRPAVFAMFVESDDWSLEFSPVPSSKFWGKNFEIRTDGALKLHVKSTGETFTWTQPTSLLKNIIAGDKYTEPSSAMTIKSSSGQKAVVEFAKAGMFSGRSEDLTIKAFDTSSKKELSYSVSGKWTESLTLKTKTAEKVIWTTGELLPKAEKKFGFTKFAGSLNKITEMERGLLPPTDSRLRPDMREYENGNLDDAERLKNELEEDQRKRRKEMETAKQSHQPKFFHHVGGNPKAPDTGEWVYNKGEDSYWNRRKNQNWDDLLKLW